MTLGPGGEILLADSSAANAKPEGGAVYIISPTERKTLVSHLDRPYGLAFWEKYLYIAEAESIKRYPYDPKLRCVGVGQEVLSLKGLGNFHWTRTLLFDQRGAKLYLAMGSGSNDTIGEDSRRAAISRMNPDGSGYELFASGLRNPVGLRWYPGTDVLWASVQERDSLGDDLVPDFLTHVDPNGFYGWPYAYIGPHAGSNQLGSQLSGALAPAPPGRRASSEDPFPGGVHHRARRDSGRTCRGTGLYVLRRPSVSRGVSRRGVPGVSRLHQPLQVCGLFDCLHSL